MTSSKHFTFIVSDAYEGGRLDKFLSDQVAEASRNRLQEIIRQGHVTVDGHKIDTIKHKIAAGSQIELFLPAAEETLLTPVSMDLEILYEDDFLIVLNKPAGLVVHPGDGTPEATLVHGLLAHTGGKLSSIGEDGQRPGIMHRLDKDTSGVMVVAKEDETHLKLAKLFEKHEITRMYQALIWGVPLPRQGHIETHIGRHPKNRKKMAVVARGGKKAITYYKVQETFADIACLADVKLETGRTHQIRVHMAHIGHPLVGDSVYGRSATQKMRKAQCNFSEQQTEVINSFNRQALHACKLGFKHPKTGKYLEFTTKCPPDMNMLVETLRTLHI